MDCFFPALREKCRDFFCLFIGGLVYPVPADLKSAVKKRFDL